MQTINLPTCPVVDAYVNYQHNRDQFKKEMSLNKPFKHAQYMTISYRVFTKACEDFYNQHQNQN